MFSGFLSTIESSTDFVDIAELFFSTDCTDYADYFLRLFIHDKNLSQ
jgi:hypothetical protein